MKNFLTKFSIILFLLMFFQYAAISQMALGVKGGVNFADMHVDYDGNSDDESDPRAAFSLGVVGEYPISDGLFLQPGVLFSGKGSKYSETEGDDYYKSFLILNYLEVPVNVVYKFDAGTMKAFVGAGPYAAFAINGKSKYKTKIDGEKDSDSEDINFGDGDDDDGIKRADFGVNVQAGVEFRPFQVGASYGLGLANLSHMDMLTYQNRVINVFVIFFISE